MRKESHSEKGVVEQSSPRSAIEDLSTKKPGVQRMPRYVTVHTKGRLRREEVANGDTTVLELFDNWKNLDQETKYDRFPSAKNRRPHAKNLNLPSLPSPRGMKSKGRSPRGKTLLASPRPSHLADDPLLPPWDKVDAPVARKEIPLGPLGSSRYGRKNLLLQEAGKAWAASGRVIDGSSYGGLPMNASSDYRLNILAHGDELS